MNVIGLLGHLKSFSGCYKDKQIMYFMRMGRTCNTWFENLYKAHNREFICNTGYQFRLSVTKYEYMDFDVPWSSVIGGKQNWIGDGTEKGRGKGDSIWNAVGAYKDVLHLMDAGSAL